MKNCPWKGPRERWSGCHGNMSFMFLSLLFYRAIQTIETAIGRSIVTVIENFITFLSCFAIAFYVNWELAAVTASLLPPWFVLAYIIGKVLYCMHAYTEEVMIDKGVSNYNTSKVILSNCFAI